MFKPFSSRKRPLSCGIVILNPSRELLLCHVTGQRHWDLPKGGIHSGETEREAALRETREETGLQLSAAQLIDLGHLAYTPKKDLHLFATVIERIDTRSLVCQSHCIERLTGRRIPEMDRFGWFGLARISELCTANMAVVLERRLDLGALLDARVIAEASPEERAMATPGAAAASAS